jgi:hypothetical protein
MRRFGIIAALGALLSMSARGDGPPGPRRGAGQEQGVSRIQVTVVAKATSNLSTGTGSSQADLTVDFSPGGSCNIVDEPGVFTFDNGTISTHSHHEDCATNGLRIDMTFQVTGGTGAFAGASGGGHEFNAFPAPAPVIYNGTISF